MGKAKSRFLRADAGLKEVLERVAERLPDADDHYREDVTALAEYASAARNEVFALRRVAGV